MQNKFILISILILAIFLRIFRLDNLPPSLNWDEVSIGYNAYSILKTSQDEWGEKFPLSFRAFGDYKLPGYVYLDVPFIAIFGLNEWGVRLPSALLGIGFALLIFLILKKLINGQIAIWGMFLVAILPWTIIVSRIALEASLALFLTTLGLYLFLMGIKKNTYLLFSALIFGLTIFSYNSSRVVTSLFLVVLGIIYSKELVRGKVIVIISVLIFTVFFAVALPRALQQDSSARYRWTMILDTGAINRINELRGHFSLNSNLSIIIYNKVTYFLSASVINYVSHFDPNFLFFKGGSNYQFSVPGSGLIYPFLAPFFILGLIEIFRKKERWKFAILGLLIVSVVPAAITRDSPHALRSIMMIPALIIVICLGINFLLEFKKYINVINLSLIMLLFFSLYLFLVNYSGAYLKNYSWVWQYGYREVIDFVNKDGNHYDKIFFSKKYGEPHEFVLFYLKYDPEKYRTDPNLIRYQKSDWFWVDRFNKFVFLNDWEVNQKAICDKREKCLLVTSPGNFPLNSNLLKTISFLDGKMAFDIVDLPSVK